LSLAIGKKGQNVRLAAKLTGWRIDIKSEEEKRREVEEQFGALGAGTADETDAGEIAGMGGETDAGESAAPAESAEGAAGEPAETAEAAAPEQAEEESQS
jgi:hypothetical protein